MKFLCALFLFFPLLITAQERCATEIIPANRGRLESRLEFENWLSRKKQQKMMSAQAAGRHRKAEVFTIPVAVHIIHDGSPIGEGSNLSDERITEQIAILNADFTRQNADTIHTPEVFLPVAADSEIQFILAKQDPEGLPTNGIVRVKGSKTEYIPSTDDALLTSESFWPPEHYMNLYITNLTGGNLGYAQFPFSNLKGIASELENYRHTDAVVIDFNWVGQNDLTGSFESRGRTATHEVGHFFGLRHIWGDGTTNCSSDDYCEDTPLMQTRTTGCPTNKNTCTNEEGPDLPDMIQNYMDYTDDECMNIFTSCQKERMRAVLESSPRRKSLLISPALEEPVLVSNDLGIRSVISPDKGICSEEVIPRVQLRNYGTNQITSYRMALLLNGSTIETVDANEVLDPLELTETAFSPIVANSHTENVFTFLITEVNNVTDEKISNNQISLNLPPFESQLLPYAENFESENSLFRTTENGSNSIWSFTTATDSSATNKAVFLPFYNHSQNFGVQDLLLTKVLDLSSITSAQINFKYAYAARKLQESGAFYYLDGLIVAVSTGCGDQFHADDFLFERYGNALSTVLASDSAFEPAAHNDWEEVSLNLTNYTGHENLQIAFIGVNGGGNNLYLDNISITSANLLALDAGLRSVSNLPIVTCNTSLTPTLEVKNYGYEKIEQLRVTIEVNDQAESLHYSDLNIFSGYTEYLNLKAGFTDDSSRLNWELDEGANEISIVVDHINGIPDEQPSNNSIHTVVMVNSETEVIPVKENFNELTWSISSPTGQSVFDLQSVNGNDALVALAFDATYAGSQSYLISPLLETADYEEAAIRFRYAYAQRPGFNDNLKVLLSSNCGNDFDIEVLNLNSEQLTVTTSTEAWSPEKDEDWKTLFVNISEYLIWDELRVAIVFTNGNGNNLYIDDVEVITSADPDLPEFAELVTLYPNPAKKEFNVSLNLFEKQDVVIRMVDMSGKMIFSQTFPGAINQTYHFNAPDQSGFYLLQVLGSDGVLNQVKRLYIQP